MWWRRRRALRELEEDIREHIDRETDANIALGLPPDEARRQARIRFGNPTIAGEDTRAAWGWRWVERLGQDVRFAARRLRRTPGFTLTTVLTLALGVGTNIVLFAVADTVIFRPFPFQDQERLVIGGEDRIEPRAEVSYANFSDWRRRAKAFAGLEAIVSSNFALIDSSPAPEILLQRSVSGGFFDLLGVRAALGRTLAPSDDRLGAPRVVVISDGLWRNRFGTDEGIVGTSITLSELDLSGSRRLPEQFTVVGVMPAGFAYPPGADLWSPLVPALAHIGGPGMPNSVEERAAGLLYVVGRLRDGVTLDNARADLTRVIQETDAQQAQSGRVGARLVPLVDDLIGSARPSLWALLAAAGLLLLVALANVAGLMLVRSSQRQREFALRQALGASRGAVVRQVLVEHTLLMGLAVAASLLAAVGLLPVVLALIPADVPRIADATIGVRVVVFTIGLSAVASVVFSAVPAAGFGSRLPVVLGAAGRTLASGGLRRPARKALVASEVAIAVLHK